jgi:hypothetical protein
VPGTASSRARSGEVARRAELLTRGRGAEEIVVADEVSASSIREGLGSVIFTASFVVVALGVAIWWLKRNA